MTENNQFNQFVENLTDVKSEDQSQEKKKSVKKGDVAVKIIENPIRTLPSLINEFLDKNFSIVLSKNGYFVSGFYGLNQDTDKKGYAFAQETEEGCLVFYDMKGHKHVIKTFEDAVNFNSLVWGAFYKLSEQYKKPDQQWFGYMLEFGALNITPNVK